MFRSGVSATSLGEPLFFSADVAHLAGISLRQLQWWDERKLISPRKDDHRRIYTPEQVLEVLTVAALRRKQVSLQKIRNVLRQLHRKLAQQNKLFLGGADCKVFLVTDGESIWFDEEIEGVVNRLVGAKTPMYVVSLTDQLNRITSAQKTRRYQSNQLPLFENTAKKTQ